MLFDNHEQIFVSLIPYILFPRGSGRMVSFKQYILPNFWKNDFERWLNDSWKSWKRRSNPCYLKMN